MIKVELNASNITITDKDNKKINIKKKKSSKKGESLWQKMI